MSYPGWHNGWADADLEELSDDGFPGAGDLDMTWPTLTRLGGIPYEGTYILKRQGDRVLTPTGWHYMEDLDG